MTQSITRGLALFLGIFTLINLTRMPATPALDANLWWVDMRAPPGFVQFILLVTCGAVFLGFAVRPHMGKWRQRFTLGVMTTLCALCLANAIAVWQLHIAGAIDAGFPLPFSLLVAVVLAVIGISALRNRSVTSSPLRITVVMAMTLAVTAPGFAFAQMFCFGQTDYRRPADAVVIFGARVYTDGHLSDALADRVRTGCDLYHEGLADYLVMSGGPGDGDIHETKAMRDFAVAQGVPAEAILLDEHGLNTRATVENTTALFGEMNIRSIMAVSHGYHLPRIKMTYQQHGLDVYTVPAKETYTLRQLPYNMLREVAALIVYYAGV